MPFTNKEPSSEKYKSGIAGEDGNGMNQFTNGESGLYISDQLGTASPLCQELWRSREPPIWKNQSHLRTLLQLEKSVVRISNQGRTLELWDLVEVEHETTSNNAGHPSWKNLGEGRLDHQGSSIRCNAGVSFGGTTNFRRRDYLKYSWRSLNSVKVFLRGS